MPWENNNMAPSCMLDYALLGKFTASTPRVLPNVGCFIHRKLYSGPAEKETMFLQTWLLVIISDIVVQRSYIFYSNLHNKVIKLTEKHNIHNILKKLQKQFNPKPCTQHPPAIYSANGTIAWSNKHTCKIITIGLCFMSSAWKKETPILYGRSADFHMLFLSFSCKDKYFVNT